MLEYDDRRETVALAHRFGILGNGAIVDVGAGPHPRIEAELVEPKHGGLYGALANRFCFHRLLD
jgi:hypothetical protein